MGTTRVVLGPSGDFGASTTTVSHHVAGNSDPNEAQCQVCHEMSNHMAGTVRLRHADTDTPIAYDPSAPSTLEPFCLSCHDALGATAASVPTTPGGSAKNPFADGRALGTVPNIAGDKIEGYWNNTYTVHKDNSLTCAGSGEPGSGCHGNGGTINMHGSVTKGLLTKNLTLPVPSVIPSNPSEWKLFDYNDYKLCFDCHESYPEVSKEVVLGVKETGNYNVPWAMTPYFTAGIQTLFRDRYIANAVDYPPYWFSVNQLYNNNFHATPYPYIPLHNWHLSANDFMDIAWNYRGNELGRASCITCHNVHGTAGTVRSTYDEFGITDSVAEFPGGYKDLSKHFFPWTNYGNDVLMEYPMSCNWNCHRLQTLDWDASYWHTPSDE